MSNPATDSKMVKSIGASGQISLGKEFAGRQVLIESPAKGVWIIQTAIITPDHVGMMTHTVTQGDKGANEVFEKPY